MNLSLNLSQQLAKVNDRDLTLLLISVSAVEYKFSLLIIFNVVLTKNPAIAGFFKSILDALINSCNTCRTQQGEWLNLHVQLLLF